MSRGGPVGKGFEATFWDISYTYWGCIHPPFQGRKTMLLVNHAFGKPCFCLGDTCHFRHFCRFGWVRGANPLCLWVEHEFVIFAVSSQRPLLAGDKKHGLPKARFLRSRPLVGICIELPLLCCLKIKSAKIRSANYQPLIPLVRVLTNERWGSHKPLWNNALGQTG